MDLRQLGWHPFFESHFSLLDDGDLAPARVVREDRGLYTIAGETGESAAQVSGKFRNDARSRAAFPAVGDWVAAAMRMNENAATIHAVLPRRSQFVRKEAGARTEAQVAAANVDTVFLVAGLDGDFNPRRIERYVTAAWESGAQPVVVLNKADLCTIVDECIAEVEIVAIGVPVHAVSAATDVSLEALDAYLTPGNTVAFLGSSGVGKSTLVNRLAGFERQATQNVRADDSHGRHTTTRRELIVIPDRGIVIDTPGMRELQLWGDESALERSFADIDALSRDCRFKDCRHENEPGCAVHEALADGRLELPRYQGFLKLRRELQYLERKQDRGAQAAEKAKWKKIHKEIRRINRD